ncbi:MAG: hypothetical protein AAF456_24625, partial [Planctomycetota bacterium]
MNLCSLVRVSLLLLFFAPVVCAQEATPEPPTVTQRFGALKFRNIGPFRGGRSNAVTGVPGNDLVYFFGSTGGGIWKTEDAGITWKNVSDGQIKSGSVGAIAVAQSDPNLIYAGMGEHAVRGVMTSHGDGVYKSTDGGKTWKHSGLSESRHIAAIRIHPDDPDHVYVAVQGSLYGPSSERGVYRSTDGGENWQQVLFVNETTSAADLSMDANNPRILYAGMWDNVRSPWQIRSGGEGSGIHKSTDGGETWTRLTAGLPESMGKVAVDVSPANSNIVYANIEADKGGVYRSDNAGKTWKLVNSDRVTVARAWYYIEIFADPRDEDQVYVLNAPMLKSIDGGNTFSPVPNPHTDQHDLWINPEEPRNMILANDGGACITFNGGRSWSPQNNQPTAQFYRVIADNQFPYRVYGGQQDNSTVSIASRSLRGGISERDWFPTAGGESAFIAFDPDDPSVVYGTSIQGILSRHDLETDENKSVVVYPQLNLGTLPVDQKYRFNWNGPIAAQIEDPSVLYTGGNVLFRSDDAGQGWVEISPDLTRNEIEKHGDGSIPFTNEAAGGEVYNTISYIAPSPHASGEIWVGTDDGLIHRTTDEGASWTDVTPNGLEESLVNAIDVSPHDEMTAFAAVTRYKFDDLSPMAYATIDGGRSWASIVNGFEDGHFVRVVRQDPVNPHVLYAGTEGGLYVSFNFGAKWQLMQLNLPVCPITDLTFSDNDLIVATSGRSFWILDDLGAIQQSSGELDATTFHLFQPKDAFKYESATSAAASPLQGQNPLPGVIFDYHLPDSWTDKMRLTLTVIDADGVIIREMNSEKVADPKKWDGGPAPKVVLPAKAGLNRFHWNLRTDPIPGVNNVFVMGSHNGARVVPGEYTLRLTTDHLDPAEHGAMTAPVIEHLEQPPRRLVDHVVLGALRRAAVALVDEGAQHVGHPVREPASERNRFVVRHRSPSLLPVQIAERAQLLEHGRVHTAIGLVGDRDARADLLFALEVRARRVLVDPGEGLEGCHVQAPLREPSPRLGPEPVAVERHALEAVRLTGERAVRREDREQRLLHDRGRHRDPAGVEARGEPV